MLRLCSVMMFVVIRASKMREALLILRDITYDAAID